jgi:hypothetical protein
LKSTLTTAGDLIIATGNGTYQRHAVPATNGMALIADSSQTDKYIADYPLDRYDAYSRPGAAIAETVPRMGTTAANGALLTSGTLRLAAIMLPANRVISSITWLSATQALVAGTNQWFALFDSSRVMLAVTADDTSNAWAASAAKTLNIATIASGASATFTTTYAGLYYLGIMVAAGTTPSVPAIASLGSMNGLAPILTGNSSTAQTTPPVFPFTAAAIGASAQTAWGFVS